MFKMFLLLSIIQSLLYSSTGQECCGKKTVGDVEYTFVGNREEAMTVYGCKDTCLYERADGTEDNWYCFEYGDLPLQNCEVIEVAKTFQTVFVENGGTYEQENMYNPTTGVLQIKVPRHGKMNPSLTYFFNETMLKVIGEVCQVGRMPNNLNISNINMKSNTDDPLVMINEKISYKATITIGLASEDVINSFPPDVRKACEFKKVYTTEEMTISQTEFLSNIIMFELPNTPSGRPRHGRQSGDCRLAKYCLNTGGDDCKRWTNDESNLFQARHYLSSIHYLEKNVYCVDCCVSGQSESHCQCEKIKDDTTFLSCGFYVDRDTNYTEKCGDRPEFEVCGSECRIKSMDTLGPTCDGKCFPGRQKCGNYCLTNADSENYFPCGSECLTYDQPCEGKCGGGRILCRSTCQTESEITKFYWNCDGKCLSVTNTCRGICPEGRFKCNDNCFLNSTREDYWFCLGTCQLKTKPCGGKCFSGRLFCDGSCIERGEMNITHQICDNTCKSKDLPCKGTCLQGSSLRECSGQCLKDTLPCGNGNRCISGRRLCGTYCIEEKTPNWDCDGSCISKDSPCNGLCDFGLRVLEGSCYNRTTFESLTWMCDFRAIPLSSPCGTRCSSNRYLYCNGTCYPATYFKQYFKMCLGICILKTATCEGNCRGNNQFCDGKCVSFTTFTYNYKHCNDICISNKIPCDGKCKDHERIYNGNCATEGFIRGNTQPCNGEIIDKNAPCNGECIDSKKVACNNLCINNATYHNLYKDCNGTCIDNKLPCNGACSGDLKVCQGTCIAESSSEFEHYQICSGTCIPRTDKCGYPRAKCYEGFLDCNGSCIFKEEYDRFYKNCGGKCIHIQEPCNGMCQDFYILCHGVCITTSELEFGLKECNGKCINYYEKCNGECQDPYISCDDSWCYRDYELEYFNYKLCDGVCLNNSKPCNGECPENFRICKDECISMNVSCHGKCPALKIFCGGFCYDETDLPDGTKNCDGYCHNYFEPCNGACESPYIYCNSGCISAFEMPLNFKECKGNCIEIAEPCDEKCSSGYQNCDGTCIRSHNLCNGACQPDYCIFEGLCYSPSDLEFFGLQNCGDGTCAGSC